VADSLPLCKLCGEASAHALLSIPSLVAELAITRAGLGRLVAHAAGGRGAETPTPVRAFGVCARCADPDHPDGPCGKCRTGVRIQGDPQLARLDNAVTTWARAIAEDMGVSVYIGGPALLDLTARYRHARTDRYGRPYLVEGVNDPGTLPLVPVTAMEQAAVWLSQQRQPLRAHEAAYELLRDVGAIVDQLRRIVDVPPELHYVGACPHVIDEHGAKCGRELRADREASWVRCPSCGTQVEVAELLRDTLANADHMLMSIDEALALLDRVGDPLPIGTFRSWVSRHRIEPRKFRRPSGQIVETSARRDDEPMYLFGEIRELQLAGKRHALAIRGRR
jgi:hypothetical protein